MDIIDRGMIIMVEEDQNKSIVKIRGIMMRQDEQRVFNIFKDFFSGKLNEQEFESRVKAVDGGEALLGKILSDCFSDNDSGKKKQLRSPSRDSIQDR